MKPRSWKRKLTRAAVVYALIPYLAVTVIFVVMQRRFLYRPSVAVSLRVADLKLDADKFSDVQLTTPDGEILNGWLIREDRAETSVGKGLVIYFPGNSLNRNERIDDLREVASCGFDVLIFDYRGFGDSKGRPSESALSSDARLIWDYAHRKLGYQQGSIVVFGESLGGAVALSLWSDTSTFSPIPRQLILSSTFASIPRTVGLQYPWFPFRYFVFDRWPSLDRIAHVPVPMTIFHGTADEMVPISEAVALSGAAGSQCTFCKIPGALHNDIPTQRLCEELTSLAAPRE